MSIVGFSEAPMGDNLSSETKLRVMRWACLLTAVAALTAVYFGHAWGVVTGGFAGFLVGTLRAIEVVDAIEVKHEENQS
jgi:hypothetical protein